jgi:hypothetical protein
MTKFRPLVLAVIAVLTARLAIAAILPHWNSARFGFAAVGAISSGAPFLGLWLVLGDGRLSHRAAITAAIAGLARWSLFPLDLDDSYEGPWRHFNLICGQIDTQSLMMTTALALGLRLVFGMRFQSPDSARQAGPGKSVWQLTIGDLIAFTFVAAVLTYSRDWLFGSVEALVSIPGGFGGAIVIGLNCIAVQTAAIGVCVGVCCLGQKLRGILALALSLTTVLGVFLLHGFWLWLAYNGPGMDIHSLFLLAEAAAGSFAGSIVIAWMLRSSPARICSPNCHWMRVRE